MKAQFFEAVARAQAGRPRAEDDDARLGRSAEG
jgi:hypothetical protein